MNRTSAILVVTGGTAVAIGAILALVPAGPWRAPADFVGPAPSTVSGPTEATAPASTAPVPTTETTPTTSMPAPITSVPATPATTTTSVDAATSTTTTSATPTTAPPAPTTTSAPAPVDRASLTVVVANANGVPGIAGATASELVAAGYVAARPADALERAATSVVYFRDGLDVEAARLVADLGWDGVELAPLGRLPAIEASGEFDLVVLIGLDRA